MTTTARKMGKKASTPLSRAQKRLERWRGILNERLHAKNFSMVGMVSMMVEGDKSLEAKLVEEARAAVKDWEVIVKAVEQYKA